ncbi:hypothetical protein DAEQUDRAFT_763465 [Daedalea quercina L-15889]|uniref:Cryptic loci regulator 2 N-terminal domain-containing protein n=1 Tax=Daedalea quercina L-15889 TaxID=1314783 RepID=A0A165SH26_9APHY|nr:hypothetical protein DAEQUDRAFT_763465 [Daedalea quercina L-15889]
MSHRRSGAHHVMPDNPEWITFPRSDGDPKCLPKNTERIVDSKGEVNYMRVVLLDESAAINWRVSIGSQLATMLNLPEGPNYVLQDWPSGYQFYDHNKGPVASPRHDPYLCGSTLVNRFRSMNEFTPHAFWLMTDETLSRANCACKYCAKKPQRVVTEVLDLPSGPRRTSSLPGSPSKSIRRHREIRKPKPYAQVRRAPKPLKAPRTGPDQSLVPERDTDIRHALVTGGLSTPRWHRKSEVVWCAINPPIRGETEDDFIEFWPGYVERVDVHTELRGKVDTNGLPTETQPAVQGLGARTADDIADIATPPTEPMWDLHQWQSYNIKLFAITHACAVSDREVLPYLAYAPPGELLGRLQDLLPEVMQSKASETSSDLSRTFDFDPIPKPPQDDGPSASRDPTHFRDAVAPFSLAVQIASNVAGYWSPTDEWECKFSVPLDKPPPAPGSEAHAPAPSQEPDSGMSLHAIMNQAAQNNAVDVNRRATAQHMNVDGIYRPPGMPDGEFEQMRIRILGQRMSGSQIVTQTRYQGLWWGAEHIWTDELVRLKLARCQFAPAGTDIFYPPAGPSASARAHAEGSGYAGVVEESQMGAAEKGLFMLLEGLFVADIPNEDGSIIKECRGCGQLYELADEDWEDPTETNQQPSQANGSGKGKRKERASDSVTGDVTSDDAIASHGSSGPSFMPGPSPLKPPPLPNPDPTVSVADTAKAAMAQTTRGVRKSTRTVGGQLSHPPDSVPYALPKPPKGFKFRRIHPTGHEVVVSLSLISGRYYPGLLEHPLMQSVVQKAFEVPPEDGGLDKSRHIWAMEGLVAGVHQSMDSQIWKSSRNAMFKDADIEARDHFTLLWEEIKGTQSQVDGTQLMSANAMDVEIP